MLLNVNGIHISTSTLRRHLKSLGLLRLKVQSDLLEVTLFLLEQLNRHLIGHMLAYKGTGTANLNPPSVQIKQE